MGSKEPELFKTKIVLAKEGSGKLFEEVFEQNQEPVTCLGMEFKNDAARRAYFTDKLKEKLQDPEFKKIEGFPIGEDDDILALSDPPYYTACPNPWIQDFIEQWEGEKPKKDEDYEYHREPFAADVSEGKNDPIYNAHSYHTKVPHKAIMRYILHYTEPGDIIFDGFCGTGMTGVAAQMCGDRATVESLGYQVKPDGTILQQEETEEGKKIWLPFSKLGARKAVLNDLSPAATFIAYNHNTPVDVHSFESEAKRIFKEVEKECGWMYKTKHSDGRIGKINYTLWSDIFVCPQCLQELVFWKEAVDAEIGKVKDDFSCPNCNVFLKKHKLERAWSTNFDSVLNKTIRRAKQLPVLISYSIPGQKKRFEKTPDDFDLNLIKKIEESTIEYWFPTNRLPDGYNTRQPIKSHGIKNLHHFYTKRNLWGLSILGEKVKFGKHRFLLTGIACRSTLMNRIHLKNYFFGGGGWNAGYLKGTLYISSLPIETSILEQLKDRINSCIKAFNTITSKNYNLTSTESCETIKIPDSSVDYLFIDPPFGSNINYSELNIIWENWIRVLTDNRPEAIENSVQKKGPAEYHQLMTVCFKEACRVLKPGRWMTIEFSNTKASVWNSIQTALTEAGFIVANVSALDKKQGSFKAVTTPTAVKQDLVISAYKPNGGFEKRFIIEAESEEGVWDFIRTHLKYLPVIKKLNQDFIAIPERDPRILFDQVVSYYVRKGFHVPISSKEFQIGLEQRFPERDGMYFLPEQVAEYDKKKTTASEYGWIL